MVHHSKNQSGMTVIELSIVLAVITILSTVAIPSLDGWSKNQKLKSFCRNIFSNMQRTRTNAIKHNRTWEIEFDSGGYAIKDDSGNTFEDVRISDHSTDIKYGNPEGGSSYGTNPLQFNSRGLLNASGFVYVTDNREEVYYRVGAQFTTGSIRVQKWNGSGWN